MFKKSNIGVNCFFMVILIFSLSACGGWNYKNLKKTDQVAGEKLRQNWDDYRFILDPLPPCCIK